jgi:predicted transposase/invertase (TIGR01784 family)
LIKDLSDGKSCILDILAVLQDGTKVNIEVQLRNEHNMDQRSLFYWSKLYSESLKEGQDYRELPNVAAINIVDFDFPSEGDVHTCFRLREDADSSLILSPALEIHFVNMVRWRKQGEKDLERNPLHRWLVWFSEDSPPELVEEVLAMDGAIMAAQEKQEYVTQDWEARDLYRRRQKAQWDLISGLNGARMEGEQIGLQKGEQIGEEKKAIEIARKMKYAGRPCNEIEEFTGLPAEVITTL